MRIGLSGHRNIPPQAVEFVRRGIARIVSGAAGDLVGVASLAAGADQMFASAVLEHGGRLHVIIPCRGFETTFPRPDDLARYTLLLGEADTVDTLDYAEPSDDAYLAAGQRVVDNSDFLVAVWDGQPARGRGGTADVVRYARERGVGVRVVWPRSVAR